MWHIYITFCEHLSSTGTCRFIWWNLRCLYIVKLCEILQLIHECLTTRYISLKEPILISFLYPIETWDNNAHFSYHVKFTVRSRSRDLPYRGKNRIEKKIAKSREWCAILKKPSILHCQNYRVACYWRASGDVN